MKVLGRFFLVGCPRSGTTLLQSMLGAHPLVFAPWETHFFRKALKPRSWLHRRLGFAVQRGARRGLRELARLTEQPLESADYPSLFAPFPQYARAFCRMLDRATLARGGSYWSEKTPQHLHHIAAIERTIPSVRFVHVLRDGRDVVASLVDLSHRDPTEWVHQLVADGAQDGLSHDQFTRLLAQAAVERWNLDVGISLDYRGQAGHLLVRYADLIGDPREELRRISSFLSLRFCEDMLSYAETAGEMLRFRRGIVGCENLGLPLHDTHLKKYDRMFDAEQRALIEEQLASGGVPG